VPNFMAIVWGDPLSISPQIIYHQKLHSLAYISAAESMRVSSTTFTQSAQKALNSAKLRSR